MTRWRVRACPRCHGDMFMDRDMDSWYQQCLQCSYRVELKPLVKIKEPALAGKGARKNLEEDEGK